MFDYEIIEPVFPGKHVEGWKDIRKKQWKAVKNTMDYVFAYDKDDLKFVKDYILLEAELDFSEISEVYEWPGSPLSGWFLNPDQTEEAFEKQWMDLDKYMNFNLKTTRKKFLLDVHELSDGTGFGAFGGLEQRMFPYLIRSKVYTDDTFTFGKRKQEVRLIPWQSPKQVHEDLLYYMGQFTTRPINPFTPYQWLHEMYYSTFQYDIDYDYSGDEYHFMQFKKFIDCDNPGDVYHINHIKMAQRIIEIFEDESAPKYIQNLWQKVKDGHVS